MAFDEDEMIIKPTRRKFLIGLLAAPAIVRIASLDRVRGFIVPTVYGDGIHDDTIGMKAALADLPYWQNGNLCKHMMGEVLSFPVGDYSVRDTLRCVGPDVTLFEGGTISFKGDFRFKELRY
jgi:hypothetical protein